MRSMAVVLILGVMATTVIAQTPPDIIVIEHGGAPIGRIFTTRDATSGKWTERVVLSGASTAPYLGRHMLTPTGAAPSSYAASHAEWDRDDFVASQADSMSAEIKFYYEDPPTSAASTPTRYSTRMYRVEVYEDGGWDEQGLMFREHNGKAFRDFWLLEPAYDAHLAGEQIRLQPIWGGSRYFTDRKVFVESQAPHYADGHFIETSYVFTVD